MPKKPISAFDVALKLLAGRDKSHAQLELALVRKNFTVEEIRTALERCSALGYLDDARASVDVARKLFAEGRSLADVEQRLEMRGLDPTVARGQPHDDLKAAQRLLEARKVSGLRAARLLAARGFNEELVARLVEVPDSGE